MNKWTVFRWTLPLCAVAGWWALPGAAQPAVEAPHPIAIFLPPVPPILGQPLPPKPATDPWPAPASLASDLNELFYAPLSTRLFHQDIDDALGFRLETYRAAKATLLTELRAQLDTLRDADAATRERTLAALSRDQSARLAALEDTADRLREDLGTTGSGGKEYVRWRVGLFSLPPQPPAAQPALRRQLLAAAAYYQRGLSPDQRRLLVAQVCDLTPGASAFLVAAGSAEVLDFSPASARIEVPSDLTPALVQEIAAYRAEKKALETAIEAALYGADKAADARAQIAALAALARAQAPRFTALEDRAEIIRRGLVVLVTDPLQMQALPTMPPALAARIAAHRTEQHALQQALLDRVEAVKRTAGANGTTAGDAIQRAITEFTHENADRYAALDRDRDEIRSDLAKLPGAPASGGGSSSEALLAKFSQSLRDLERAWDYHDYRIAVLQPGLSPEQRRLLFGGALEKLSLPLPGASLWFGAL